MKEEKKKLASMLTPLDIAKIRGKQVKEFGKKIWALPGKGINKLKDGWHSLKGWISTQRDNLEEYATSEREEMIGKKTAKIDERIDNISNAKENLASAVENDKDKEKIKPYMEVAESKIEKLKAKKVKVSSRGKSVFALSMFSIKKLTKNGIGTIQQKYNQAKENYAQRKIDRAAEKEKLLKEKELATILSDNKEIAEMMKQAKEFYEGLEKRLKSNMEKIAAMQASMGAPVNTEEMPKQDMDIPDKELQEETEGRKM